jgi:hypothetical protein
MNQPSNMNIEGAIELSDADLGSIQGGNIFGDAWNAVKGAVSPTINAIVHPVDTYHKVEKAVSDFIGSLKKPWGPIIYL